MLQSYVQIILEPFYGKLLLYRPCPIKMVNAHSKLQSFHQKNMTFCRPVTKIGKEEALSHVAPQRSSSQTAQAQAFKAQSEDFKVAPRVIKTSAHPGAIGLPPR